VSSAQLDLASCFLVGVKSAAFEGGRWNRAREAVCGIRSRTLARPERGRSSLSDTRMRHGVNPRGIDTDRPFPHHGVIGSPGYGLVLGEVTNGAETGPAFRFGPAVGSPASKEIL